MEDSVSHIKLIMVIVVSVIYKDCLCREAQPALPWHLFVLLGRFELLAWRTGASPAQKRRTIRERDPVVVPGYAGKQSVTSKRGLGVPQVATWHCTMPPVCALVGRGEKG